MGVLFDSVLQHSNEGLNFISSAWYTASFGPREVWINLIRQKNCILMNIKAMLLHCSSPRVMYKEKVCLQVLQVLPGILLVESAKCNYTSRTRDYHTA